MYKKEFFPCEDFELFLRIGDKIIFANVPERLYSIRIRAESIMEHQLEKSLKIYHMVAKLYAYKYMEEEKSDKDTSFQTRSLQKLDILSLIIYRKGLHYYLNKNLLVGLFYFFISSLLNPFRLFNALKRRFLHLINYNLRWLFLWERKSKLILRKKLKE